MEKLGGEVELVEAMLGGGFGMTGGMLEFPTVHVQEAHVRLGSPCLRLPV